MAGLAAAYELATSGAEVVVLEGSDRIGGKLRLGEVGGLTLGNPTPEFEEIVTALRGATGAAEPDTTGEADGSASGPETKE